MGGRGGGLKFTTRTLYSLLQSIGGTGILLLSHLKKVYTCMLTKCINFYAIINNASKKTTEAAECYKFFTGTQEIFFLVYFNALYIAGDFDYSITEKWH